MGKGTSKKEIEEEKEAHLTSRHLFASAVQPKMHNIDKVASLW